MQGGHANIVCNIHLGFMLQQYLDDFNVRVRASYHEWSCLLVVLNVHLNSLSSQRLRLKKELNGLLVAKHDSPVERRISALYTFNGMILTMSLA